MFLSDEFDAIRRDTFHDTSRQVEGVLVETAPRRPIGKIVLTPGAKRGEIQARLRALMLATTNAWRLGRRAQRRTR